MPISPFPAKHLLAGVVSEPGFDCSERWSPERTFVIANKDGQGFSGIQELSEPGFKCPSLIPFEVAASLLKPRGVPEMLMKLFQARTGAHCSVLPHALISLVPRPPVFLSGGWSSAARQNKQ